jgi:hypothetical protein
MPNPLYNPSIANDRGAKGKKKKGGRGKGHKQRMEARGMYK